MSPNGDIRYGFSRKKIIFPIILSRHSPFPLTRKKLSTIAEPWNRKAKSIFFPKTVTIVKK